MEKCGDPRRSHTAATEEIKIRDAAEADLPAIVEIHNETIASRISTAQLDPVTVEGRREWFRAHSTTQSAVWAKEAALPSKSIPFLRTVTADCSLSISALGRY